MHPRDARNTAVARLAEIIEKHYHHVKKPRRMKDERRQIKDE
jgi:hypothetical protein